VEPIEHLLIERECERLVYSYCHVIDHGEAARVADMFTEDGAWLAPGVNREGKAAVAKGFQARQDNVARMSRHVCSTPVIDVIDADTARGVTYIILFRHDGEPGRKVSPLEGLPEIVGEYHDVFARTADGWRFKRREFVTAFQQTGAARAR
jgi:ketosteroid isomerase-like protein